MNYYIPNSNQKLYLYDKARGCFLCTFQCVNDFKRWLIRNLTYTDHFRSFHGSATDLTMGFSAPEPVYRNSLTFVGGDFKWDPTDEIIGYKKHLVVITNIKSLDKFSVFNYVPFLDELKNILIRGGTSWGDISFDSCYSARMRWRRSLPEFRRGPVPSVHKVNSSSSPHLIVSKRERWERFYKEIDAAYYDAETDSFVEYEIPRIKVRAARKELCTDPWEGSYAEHLGKYRRHKSWKEHKKEAQWM